jgi:hypothetical protein
MWEVLSMNCGGRELHIMEVMGQSIRRKCKQSYLVLTLLRTKDSEY